jgi:tetratricopeptide (TPR) repeat protein
VGLVVAGGWILAVFVWSWTKSLIPFAVAGVLTLAIIAAGIWLSRFMKKQQALGALLQGADTEAGRKDALKSLEANFKKGDTQATLARAQLEMQEDPRKAIETLETINLGKQLGPVADQVRSMRAMIHLTLGETQPARALVDAMEMGKQQDLKTRAMFATVAGEAWGRSGQAKKGVELLELFNPEDPELGEMKVQMWRARAFAYAGNNDMKGASRALKKLMELNPQLLGMFIMTKKVHPLLQQEAKQLMMKSGYVQRKMVRQRT